MRAEPAMLRVRPADLVEGQELPTERIEVDVARVVAGSAATRTYFGGHIDADYARRQRRRHTYLATGPILGTIDGYATRWAGPGAFLAKRKVAMRDSICAGDVVELRGRVRAVHGHVVVVGVEVVNQLDARCVDAELTLVLREGGSRGVPPDR